MANRIHRSESIRRMEDAPSSGDTLKIGDDEIGQVLECPLNVGEGWSATRTKAMELIQTGYHLIKGKLNLAAELKTVRYTDVSCWGPRNRQYVSPTRVR